MSSITLRNFKEQSSKAFSIDMMDNGLLGVFFIFLPFNMALTINIGFPLKISELILFVYFFLIILRGRFTTTLGNGLLSKSLSCFILITFVSCIFNFFSTYDYPLNYFTSRFGYKFDSILKFCYLLLSYFAFIVSCNSFTTNQEKYYKLLKLGATIASFICYYYFLSGILNFEPFFLPGMDEYPQSLNIAGLEIIRCGTMKEGNYMGLFLFYCGIISFYKGYLKSGYFFFITIITTFSTMAIGCTLVFLTFYFVRKNIIQNKIKLLITNVTALVLVVLALISIESFRFVLVDKVFTDADDVHINGAALSKADRINSLVAAIDLAKDNPYLGVGLSNYALHYREYYPDMHMFLPGFKNIINNVYAEIMAETGIFSFAFFMIFLFCLFNRSRSDRNGVITVGFLLNLFYFLTFPSFTLLYVWVFWGFIASLSNINANSSNS